MESPKKQIQKDILEYLDKHEKKDILRFITCGSVDDGKSTLIGRMLYESHQVLGDQMEALKKRQHSFGVFRSWRPWRTIPEQNRSRMGS